MTQKTVSYPILFISIAGAALAAILLYAGLSNLSFSGEPEVASILELQWREVGDDIALTGVIVSDGDLRFYTHTLDHDEYGIVGLKSRNINLSAHKGNVQIQWTIDTEIDGMIVVDVKNVVLLPEDTVETADIITSEQYIRSAGIYFPVAFAQQYTITESSSSKIAFSDDQDNAYTIQYFTCKQDKSDADCNHLASTFAQTSSKVFTTADGMTFYKMPEVDSWFTHNDGLIWYFFNEVSEANMLAISKQIDFPTIKSIEQRVIPQATTLCRDASRRLGSVDEYTMLLKNNSLHLAITGAVGPQVATCELVIDYAQPQRALLTKFAVQEVEQTSEVSEPTQQQSTPTQPVIAPSPFDINVPQFAINLERPFVFTSSRGHTISFPSQNIAFAQSEVTQDVLLSSLNCYAQQNIVSYANKALLANNPSVILYECTRAPQDSNLPSQYVVYPSSATRNFIAHVLDGAWRDFANNITILVPEE
jgi:hypothetical protein